MDNTNDDVTLTSPDPARNAPSSPMAIAMLTNLYPPLGTGSSTQSAQLARELALRGHKVVVFTAAVVPGTPDHETTPEGVEIFRLPCRKLPDLAIFMNFPWFSATLHPRNLRFMTQVIRRHGIQVLHVHNHLFDMAFSGVWLSWKLGLPLALTIHTYAQHPNFLYNAIFYPLDCIFLKHAVIDRADAVIAPDCNVQAYLSRRFRRNDGVFIPYGIAPPRPVPPEEEDSLRAEFGLHGKRVILSLGQLHPLRNRITLIQALPEVIQAHPDVRLLIVGVVGHQPTVDLVHELGLQNHVIFTGPQPHERIPAFQRLASFSAVWVDYKNEDCKNASFGIGVMEAMSYENAVISMGNIDTYGAGRLQDRKNIYLLENDNPINVRNALMNLLDNPAMAAAIGSEAANFARNNFSWEKVAEQHILLYEALKKKGSRARQTSQ